MALPGGAPALSLIPRHTLPRPYLGCPATLAAFLFRALTCHRAFALAVPTAWNALSLVPSGFSSSVTH